MSINMYNNNSPRKTLNINLSLKVLHEKIKQQEKLIGLNKNQSQTKPKFERNVINTSSEINNKNSDTLDHTILTYQESVRKRNPKEQTPDPKYNNSTCFKGYQYQKSKNDQNSKLSDQQYNPQFKYKQSISDNDKDNSKFIGFRSRSVDKISNIKFNDNTTKNSPNLKESNVKLDFKKAGYNLIDQSKFKPGNFKVNYTKKFKNRGKNAQEEQLERNLADKAEIDFEGELTKIEDKIKHNFVGIYQARSNAEEDAINAVQAAKKRPRYEQQHEFLEDMNGINRALDKQANQYTHMSQVKDKLTYVAREDVKHWRMIERKANLAQHIKENINNKIEYTEPKFQEKKDVKIENNDKPKEKKKKKEGTEEQQDTEDVKKFKQDINRDFDENFNWNFRDPMF